MHIAFLILPSSQQLLDRSERCLIGQSMTTMLIAIRTDLG